jgi:hypothetical protein
MGAVAEAAAFYIGRKGNSVTCSRPVAYLKEARQCSEASLDSVAKALNRFESYTRFRDFRTFRTEQAVAFKRHLSDQVSSKTGTNSARQRCIPR